MNFDPLFLSVVMKEYFFAVGKILSEEIMIGVSPISYSI
jgi:hypothetical protein